MRDTIAEALGISSAGSLSRLEFNSLFSYYKRNSVKSLPARELSEEEKQKVRETTLAQFSDPEKRKRHKDACVSHSDKIWINNGLNNKRIHPSEFEMYVGWTRGRLIPRNKIDEMIRNRTTTRCKSSGRFLKKGKN